jgi:iron complex outermembrane receptor protein
MRYGGMLAPDVYYRVYAEYSERGSEELPDGSSAQDSVTTTRGGFRIDSAAVPQTTLTLQGDFYTGTEFEGSVGNSGLSGDNVLARWSRALADDSNMSLQVYYDRTHLSQSFAASPAGPPYYSGFPQAPLIDNLDTYDAEFQHDISLGQQNKFIWGLGLRYTHEVDEDLSIVRFEPPILDQALYSAFAQDEITLPQHVVLTLGSKVEHNDYTGMEVQPNVRLRWNPTEKQMLWASVSRAVRTPSRYDRDLQVVTGLENAPPPYQFPATYLAGSSDFKPETLVAYEVGYRAELGSQVSLSASAFYNVYDDLRSTSDTPLTPTYPFPYPVYFQNNLEGDTHGIEVTGNYQAASWWRLHAGYDLLIENIHVKPGEIDETGALNETADPRNQFFARSSMDLQKNLQLDAAYRWVDKLTIDNGPTSGAVAGTVPSYGELDLRLAWHASKNLEISAVGQNLLHALHQEYGYPSPATEEIARGVYGKVVWRY